MHLKFEFLRCKHTIRIVILFGCVLLPLYLFGMLAEDVVEQEVFSFDKPILLFVHRYASDGLDGIMIFMSLIGSAALLVPFNILVFVFLVKRQDRIYASFWACAVTGAALLNILGKHVFERSRPNFWSSIMPEASFSFPSGHAMQSMAVVAGIVTLAWHGRWKIQIILIGIFYVFFVGFSRIYLGVHFPSDIIAGWMASLTWVVGLGILFGLSNKAKVLS